MQLLEKRAKKKKKKSTTNDLGFELRLLAQSWNLRKKDWSVYYFNKFIWASSSGSCKPKVQVWEANIVHASLQHHCSRSQLLRPPQPFRSWTRMGFGALRTLIRPLSRTLISRTSTTTPFPATSTFSPPNSELRFAFGGQAPWFPIHNHFHSLTDTRFPKRRPGQKSRRKRATMKTPGLYSVNLLVVAFDQTSM